MRNFILIVMLLVLTSLAPQNAFSATDWKLYIETDDQIFPSLIIAMANLGVMNKLTANDFGDANGLIGFEIKSPTNNCQVRVIVTCKGLIEESTYDAELPDIGSAYTIRPNIVWDYDALRKIKQPRPAILIVDVLINGKSIGKKTKTVRVRSINDCPLYHRGANHGKINDLKWMISAYVNEDHPLVDIILHEALAAGTVDSFEGYQGDDIQKVYLQVYSIWNVMQKKGVKYSSITQTSSQSPSMISQHVRFINESVGNAQANCVDGSILFASILRKIGIKPFLVLIPGHCFVGFYLDEKKTQIACLETTMMGMVNLKKFANKSPLTALFGIKSKQDVSWLTFTAAIDKGLDEFEKNLPNIADGKNPAFGIVEIDVARKLGIMPIVSISSETKG